MAFLEEAIIKSSSPVDLLTERSIDKISLVSASSKRDLVSGATSTQTNTSKILEVTGKGVVSVSTNIAQVQVGIEVEEATATKVQQKIARRSSALVDKLNRFGVKELQTISISLRPNTQFEQGKSKVVGFIGGNVLQFEIPTAQAGATIDAATKAGANIIQNISFIAPESKLNQARLEAINLAVQDAQIQAMGVFNTLNLKPIVIIDIDILGVSSPPPTSPLLKLSSAAFEESADPKK